MGVFEKLKMSERRHNKEQKLSQKLSTFDLDPAERELLAAVNSNGDSNDVGGLTSLNLCAGVLFALQSVLHYFTSQPYEVTITTPKYVYDDNEGVLRQSSRDLFVVCANHLVSIYFLIPAAIHLSLALIPPIRKSYVRFIMHSNCNPYRWLVYFISCALMVMLCCICMGIADAATLALVGGAHSAVQIFGYLAEQKRNVAALIGGWFSFSLCWGVLLYTHHKTELDLEHVPYAMLHSYLPQLFVLFLCFGLIHLVHFLGFVKSFYKIECIYTLLSFITKTS